MKRIKVADVSGPELDWLVAKCEGVVWESFQAAQAFAEHAYQYSTGWAQGGPIIEREWLSVYPIRGASGGDWRCESNGRHLKAGPTPLIAAMRCYVVSKLGSEVEVPEELS